MYFQPLHCIASAEERMQCIDNAPGGIQRNQTATCPEVEEGEGGFSLVETAPRTN